VVTMAAGIMGVAGTVMIGVDADSAGMGITTAGAGMGITTAGAGTGITTAGAGMGITTDGATTMAGVAASGMVTANSMATMGIETDAE